MLLFVNTTLLTTLTLYFVSRLVGVDPPDYRGEESYRIEFSLVAETHMPKEGFVHRTWEDFVKFDHLLTTHLLNFGLDFPSEPSVEALDEYLQRVMSHSMIVSSNMLSDLLGINWSGSDLKFLTSLPSFMQVVFPLLTYQLTTHINCFPSNSLEATLS